MFLIQFQIFFFKFWLHHLIKKTSFREIIKVQLIIFPNTFSWRE